MLGHRVAALHIEAPWPKIPPGTRGTVELYDAEAHTASVKWDNGFTTVITDADEVALVAEL